MLLMNKLTSKSPPASIDETLALLAGADYLADRSLATVLFLAMAVLVAEICWLAVDKSLANAPRPLP